jgi:hypothetical protein
MNRLILIALTLLSNFSFAQPIKLQIQKRQFIKVDSETAKIYNLDYSTILSAAAPQEHDKIYLEVNEKNEVINLGIFDEKIFAESRVDWRM